MGNSSENLKICGYLSMLFCIINLVILPFTLHLLIFKRIWHIYFRISIGLVIICSIIIAINAGIVSFLFIYYDLNIASKNITNGKDLYDFYRSFQPATTDSYRYTMWVLCGERLLATIKFKNYQEYKNKFFISFSIFFVITATLLTKYTIELLNIKTYTNHIYTIMDIPLLVIIFVLLVKNCRRKKDALFNGTDLTSKFQLNENYFLIMFSLPIITFNVLQLFFINIVAIKASAFNMNHNQLFMIVYTFRLAIYILFQLYIYFNKYAFIFMKKRAEKRIMPVEKNCSKTKSFNSKHDDSKQVRANIEKDIYFKMLQKDLNRNILH